ncbi:MAG: hypothetical protein NTU44_16230 [Bacteroidetes bacterium]|nr:hypothetical protein [Bacteroidota bacterium]
MRKIQLALFLVIMFNTFTMAQSVKKSEDLKPSDSDNKIEILTGGKTKKYYSIIADKPSVINVHGPGKLRVITRGRFIPDEGKQIQYKILYSVDGGEQKIFKANGVERSTESTYILSSLGVPAQLESFEIKLGRGSHVIEFKLKDSNTDVGARFIFSKSSVKRQDWVEYSPKSNSEPVDLVTKEEIVTYYRFSQEKPLEIEVTGPCELEVLSRIENHYQMKGRINYRLQVTENSIVINTYQLSSTRSDLTVYKNNEKLIPGKACTFEINIPKGKHKYTITPLDQDKSTILGRLLLPKKKVKLKN